MAFFSTPGIERLYSGVTKSRPRGFSDLRLQAHHRFAGRGVVVLVVERQVVDTQRRELEVAGPELGHGAGQLAVERIAAQAADDEGDVDGLHGVFRLGWVVY
jgi:hypothetical protein